MDRKADGAASTPQKEAKKVKHQPPDNERERTPLLV